MRYLRRAAEQALGADSPIAGFFVKLRGRAAQAQRSAALIDAEERYGVSTEIQMSVPEIAKARTRLIAGAIEFPFIGILVLCVGLGLRLAWPWARLVWPGVVLLLTLFHVAHLIQDYQLYGPIVLVRIVEVLLIGSLAVISWRWLFPRSSDGSHASESPAI